MKKFLATSLVATTLVLPVNVFASPTVQFTDIKGSYAENEIKSLAQLGIVSGYPDGTFKPKKEISRAEFAVVLANSLELEPKPSSAVKFYDVPMWARGAVGALVDAGIASGYSEHNFGADFPVTREQLAVFFTNAFGLGNVVDTLGLESDFEDIENTSWWAKDEVAFLDSVGLVVGYQNKFSPKAASERQAVAKLAYEFVNNGEEYLYNGLEVAIGTYGYDSIAGIEYASETEIEIELEDGTLLVLDTETGDLYEGEQTPDLLTSPTLTVWDQNDTEEFKQGDVTYPAGSILQYNVNFKEGVTLGDFTSATVTFYVDGEEVGKNTVKEDALVEYADSVGLTGLITAGPYEEDLTSDSFWNVGKYTSDKKPTSVEFKLVKDGVRYTVEAELK